VTRLVRPASRTGGRGVPTSRAAVVLRAGGLCHGGGVDQRTSDPKQKLTFQQVEGEGLADWRYLFDALHARFRTGSFATGLELVDRIGAAAEEANHHPDVVLTYPQVDVTLSSHDVGGVTGRDLALARRISGFAADLGAEPAPQQVAAIEVALDVPDHEEVQQFWATVLGYGESRWPSQVEDPSGRLPALWFQQAPDATGEVQQRFHLDIRVPREIAEDRVRAAVDAGGTLVSDADAPAFWVLADVHGNKVCVCTADGRPSGD